MAPHNKGRNPGIGRKSDTLPRREAPPKPASDPETATGSKDDLGLKTGVSPKTATGRKSDSGWKTFLGIMTTALAAGLDAAQEILRLLLAQIKRAWLNRPQLKRARLNLGQMNLAQIKRFPVHTKAVIAVLLASAILFAGLSLFGHHSRKDNNVPDYLVGVWKTPAPGYANNSMEIRKHAVLFETAPSVFAVNPVVNVEVSGADGEDLYTLHYSGDESGKEYTLSFYYYPENGGLIRFKGQKNLEWKRADQP